MKNYRFKAKIESAPGGGAYVLFPYDTEKEFGTKGRYPSKRHLTVFRTPARS